MNLGLQAIEGIYNLMASVGVLAYLIYIFRNPHRTIFERRVGILLSFYFVIISLRGIGYLLAREEEFTRFVLVLSMFFPLSAVFFVEGLMRRHVPKWLKIFSFFTPFALFFLIFIENLRLSSLLTVIFQLSVLLSLTVILFMQKSNSLSRLEINLKQKIGVAFIFGTPFFFSDYAAILNLPLVRLGCVGGLLFVIACLRFSDDEARGKLIRLYLFVIAVDAMAALLISYIVTGLSLYNFSIFFGLTTVIHLVLVILNASLLTDKNLIRSWPFKVINSFPKGDDPVSHINKILSSEGTFAYDESRLQVFDVAIIKSFFKDLKISQLNLLQLKNLKLNFAAEQLAYILEADQNNTVIVLSIEPLVFLSMSNPTITKEINLDNERILLSKFVELSLGSR